MSARAAIDGASLRLARAFTGWALPPVLLALAVGASIWPLLHPERAGALLHNALTPSERRSALWLLVVGSMFTLSMFALLVVRARKRDDGLLESVRAQSRRFALAGALPIIAVLRAPGIESERPKLLLLLVAIAAVLAGISVHAWLPSASDAPAEDRRRKLWPALAVGALWALYALFFSRLAITNHHALNTSIADLGYYDNIFHQSIHGRPLGCSYMPGGYHWAGHFDPILVLLSPLYLLYPRAELLLVLQSVWLGSAVLPLYLLAQHKLGSRVLALALAVCFALYPALHGVNLYDFHSLALVVPLLPWLVLFLEQERPRAYFVTLAALLLVREDVALLLCFVGVYAILRGGRPSTTLGWITIGVSLVYFRAVKTLIMPSGDLLNSGGVSFADYYAELMPHGAGMWGFLTTLATNPVFVLERVLTEPKLLYVAQLMLPLAFVPLLARPGRVTLLYGFAVTLLASRAQLHSIYFQYSCLIFPLAFALVPMALRQLGEHRLGSYRGVRAIVATMVAASLLSSWKIGGIAENQSFRGGWGRVARSLSAEQRATHAWVEQQARTIPPNASVASSMRLGAHVSNREKAFFWPPPEPVDYVLVDESALELRAISKLSQAKASGALVEVSRHEKLVLLRSSRAR